MKFGIDKCGVLAIKRRNEVECNGIELENGEEIGRVGEEGYKHLGVLEKRDIRQEGKKKTLGKNTLRGLEQHGNQN